MQLMMMVGRAIGSASERRRRRRGPRDDVHTGAAKPDSPERKRAAVDAQPKKKAKNDVGSAATSGTDSGAADPSVQPVLYAVTGMLNAMAGMMKGKGGKGGKGTGFGWQPNGGKGAWIGGKAAWSGGKGRAHPDGGGKGRKGN